MLEVITLDAARRAVEEIVRGLEGSVSADAQSPSGRIAAEDVLSEVDVPSFDRSLVDGFAVKSFDTFGCSDALPAVLRLTMLEAGGVRWAEESGPANYNTKGYFNPLPGAGRYKNYRKRAEGHNTLCINPAARGEDQYPFAKAAISDFVQTQGGATGSIDMTNAYFGNGVKSVVRSFEVTDNYSRVVLTDKIRLRGKKDIWWFMHTRAQAEVSPGGRECTLTRDGESLKVRILSPQDAAFTVADAQPLPSSPPYTGNSDNSGIKKLVINIKAESCDISVEFKY